MPSKDYSRDASAWDICRSFVGRLPDRAIFGAGLVYVCHAGHREAARRHRQCLSSVRCVHGSGLLAVGLVALLPQSRQV